MMAIRLTNAAIEEVSCDALIVGVAFQKNDVKEVVLSRAARGVDHLLDGRVQRLFADHVFKAEHSELESFFIPEKLGETRVILVGMGDEEKLSPLKIQRAVATAIRHAQSKHAGSVVLACDLENSALSHEEQVQAEVEGALLGVYTFKKYVSSSNGYANGHSIEQISILSDRADIDSVQRALYKGQMLAEAANFARDMVNEPPNVLTPTELANRTHYVAERFDLEIEVLGRMEMQELHMGGLLAVSQGSEEPAKFIILRYRGASQRTEKDVTLVGKGITFDTGGISIKPAERMHEMKGDMAGAAAVIGAMYAVAALKPAINVTALVPTTENMPSGTAYRPGDILHIMNGKTIEIINTDAEGRLVLADALSYAVMKEQATTIIDVATLTGGIVIALGSVMSGLFANDDGLAQEIVAAGYEAGEKFWRMPLDEEYAEQISSDVADIKQTGGRPASSATAAKILEHFVGKARWAHLDIAGTDFFDAKKSYQEKGSTGVATRTLAELILRRAEQPTEQEEPRATARAR